MKLQQALISLFITAAITAPSSLIESESEIVVRQSSNLTGEVFIQSLILDVGTGTDQVKGYPVYAEKLEGKMYSPDSSPSVR